MPWLLYLLYTAFCLDSILHLSLELLKYSAQNALAGKLERPALSVLYCSHISVEERLAFHSLTPVLLIATGIVGHFLPVLATVISTLLKVPKTFRNFAVVKHCNSDISNLTLC